MIAAVPRFSAADSSQVTRSASRPFLADHMSRATTATPRGICTTSTTPGTAFAWVASKELTLPPKRGGRMTTAVIIPGKHHVDGELLGAGGLRPGIQARELVGPRR